MKKDWKYIVYVTLAFALFVVVKVMAPKEYNWNVTFRHEDKNPYGGYALNRILHSVFDSDEVTNSYKTVYELADSINNKDNVFIISNSFSGEKADSESLLKHVEEGGNVFISAQYFWGHFADTLGVSTYDYFFTGSEIFAKTDTASLKLANALLDTTQTYLYRRNDIHSYFNHFDTTRTTVIAKNDRNLPVTIRVTHGKGVFILNSTPMIFTNICLLSRNNTDFASAMLSYLPRTPLSWTEYYHLGRMEVRTPLRFILTNEPLSWAYYVTIASILLFILFEMKRKQRIIPVIKPLPNTTLEFVETIGNLYYQTAEHKNIAEKKIHFLLDQIRSRHWMNVSQLDEAFVQTLSGKTGKPLELVRDLVNTITRIQSMEAISGEALIDFNRKIEKFNEPI